MILYLFLCLSIVLLLYIINIIRLRWNLDYYKELEKSCMYK
jgi:hypothetical protein